MRLNSLGGRVNAAASPKSRISPSDAVGAVSPSSLCPRGSRGQPLCRRVTGSQRHASSWPLMKAQADTSRSGLSTDRTWYADASRAWRVLQGLGTVMPARARRRLGLHSEQYKARNDVE